MVLDEAKMRMDKIKAKAEKYGLNPSEDALFIVSEIRDTRNFIVTFLSIIIGTIIGFSIATLSGLTGILSAVK